MSGRGGGTQGPLRIPVKPTPPKSRPELRRVTGGMNGVAKRKRQEIEGSEAEITESDDIRCLGSHDKPATPLGELTTLVAALKEVIEQQNRTIENIRNGLAEVKDQNGQLQNEVKSMRAQLETYSVSPPTTRSWASVAAGSSRKSWRSGGGIKSEGGIRSEGLHAPSRDTYTYGREAFRYPRMPKRFTEDYNRWRIPNNTRP
jgi:hypothetical protein